MSPLEIGRGNGSGANGAPLGLIRYSHIFASAVREMLEIKVLEDIGAAELTLPQFHLLKLISLTGEHQIGEVADFLGVTPPAATKNIDKLERLGLLDRTPCESDRRATLVTSSAKGRQLVDRYEELKHERLEPVLSAFSRDELSLLERMLERFSLALLRSEKDAEGLCLRCSAYYDDHCPVHHLHESCPYQRVVKGKRRRVAGGPP
jgi:DNA-binding MarR family transcriptional regulator